MKKSISNESVKVVVNAQVGNTISKANYAKGIRAMQKGTHTLNQAVKALNGKEYLSSKVEIAGKTYTFREVAAIGGLLVGKNNTVTAKAVINAWHFKDKAGNCQIWRNVPLKTMAEDPKDRKLVYQYTDGEWKTINRYQLTGIDTNGWSADIILRGILQGYMPETEVEKGRKSAEAADKVEHYYTFAKRTNKGGVSNEAKEVKKSRVMFDA